MSFVDKFLRVFNVLARLLGGFWIIGGLLFLLCAYVFPENRLTYLLVGALVLSTGIAFLLAKPVRRDQVEEIARSTEKNV